MNKEDWEIKANASCEGHAATYIDELDKELGVPLPEDAKSLIASSFTAGYWSGRVDKAVELLDASS